MLDVDPAFRPIRLHGGYPPLADLGLIGDGATAALVGLDGSVRWMCVPSFDAEPLFCALLDHVGGGEFSVAPEGLVEARQRYEPDTGVLITEMRSDTGVVRVTDALALRSGADLTDDAPANRGELVRSAVVLNGSVRLRVNVQPRGGAQPRPAFNGVAVEYPRQSKLRLHLRSNRSLSGLQSIHDLQEGDRLNLVLSWGRFHRHHPLDAEARLSETADAWRRWMTGFHYDGPERAMVRRAAITLKLCDHVGFSFASDDPRYGRRFRAGLDCQQIHRTSGELASLYATSEPATYRRPVAPGSCSDYVSSPEKKSGRFEQHPLRRGAGDEELPTGGSDVEQPGRRVRAHAADLDSARHPRTDGALTGGMVVDVFGHARPPQHATVPSSS